MIQKNDFSPDKYSQSNSVKIIHASDPADRTKDIRARPFALCWNTPNFRPPPGISPDLPVPVFRIKYKCLGHCRHGNEAAGSGEEVEDVDEDGYYTVSESESESDSKRGTKDLDPNSDNVGELNKLLDANSIPKKKPTPQKCPVRLHVSLAPLS